MCELSLNYRDQLMDPLFVTSSNDCSNVSI